MPDGGIRFLPLAGPVGLQRVAWLNLQTGEQHFEDAESHRAAARAEGLMPEAEMEMQHGDGDSSGGIDEDYAHTDLGSDSDFDFEVDLDDASDRIPGYAEVPLHDNDYDWLRFNLALPEASKCTRVIEVTDESVVIIMMPVNDPDTKKVGLDAYKEEARKGQHANRLNPFCEIRVQLLEFAEDERAFCCQCTNPFCPRSKRQRQDFAEYVSNPDRTGSTYDEICGGVALLCPCAQAALQHIWPSIGQVDADLDSDSFAAFFMEAEPRSMPEVEISFQTQTYRIVRSSAAESPWGVLRKVVEALVGEPWLCCVCDTSKGSCYHGREAGVASLGRGLSADAYQEELDSFLGEDGKRKLTCISRLKIPELPRGARGGK